MKLLQMRYFQTVCQYGSITRAAEELFVSQPTISFCIKELEDEFRRQAFSPQAQPSAINRRRRAFP